MIKVPNYKTLIALPSHPKEGEVALIDNGEFYRFKDGEWVREEQSAKITLYDINKQAIAQMPQLTDDQLIDKEKEIGEWIKQTNNNYYMLYGKELSYFTVFYVNNIGNSIGEEVIECLEGLGQIHLIANADNNAFECWVKDNNENCSVLYLFPYDGGIIECHK